MNTIKKNKNGVMELEVNCMVGEHVPTYANEFAAGLDIVAEEEHVVYPGSYAQNVPTKFAVEIPTGYFGLLTSRSGLSIKKGIKIAQGVGIIDSDYRGNVGTFFVNDSNKKYTVRKGERIAQLIVIPYVRLSLNPSDNLEETQRGTGGFGSTGK